MQEGASDGRNKTFPFVVVIIHPVVVLTSGLLCAVHLGTLLQCAALSRQNQQPFHVDRQSTCLLGWTLQARISLGAATSMEREGRDMGRLGA